MTATLPTRYRQRLPQEFSFPLGAEVLSEHLAGVPRFSECSVGFSDVTARKADFQRILAERGDYAIVTVLLVPAFEILVHPVPRALKPAARAALVATGLPLLREALLRRDPENPAAATAFRIMFSIADRTVSLRPHPALTEGKP